MAHKAMRQKNKLQKIKSQKIKLQKIKMIGLDLDGTLLNSNKELTTCSKDVLEEALAQGVVVLVATGRPVSGIPKEILQIPGMKYAVTANGARVIEIETGEAIAEHTISVEAAEKTLQLLAEYDTIHEFFLNGVGYISKNVAQADEYFTSLSVAEYFRKTRKPVDSVLETLCLMNQSVDKVQWIFKDMGEREEALARLRTVPGIEITDALGNNLEINLKGVHKGNALVELGKKIGICREEIMACGDGMNDYEMLKTVGFAVAMENAEGALKEIADYVTVSNDENGVAKAIRKFVLNAEIVE